jgi:hypothetical protein
MTIKTRQSTRRRDVINIGIPTIDHIGIMVTTATTRGEAAGAGHTPEIDQKAQGDTTRKMSKIGGSGGEVQGTGDGIGRSRRIRWIGEIGGTAMVGGAVATDGTAEKEGTAVTDGLGQTTVGQTGPEKGMDDLDGIHDPHPRPYARRIALQTVMANVQETSQPNVMARHGDPLKGQMGTELAVIALIIPKEPADGT